MMPFTEGSEMGFYGRCAA